MATNILTIGGVSGTSYYLVIRNQSGQFVNGTSLESYNAAHWTSSDYCFAFSASGGPGTIFSLTFPAIPSGIYDLFVYTQSGSSPATTDSIALSLSMEWDGTNLNGVPSSGVISMNEPQTIGPVSTTSNETQGWSSFTSITLTATPNVAMSLTVSVPSDGSSGSTLSLIQWEVWGQNVSGGQQYKIADFQSANLMASSVAASAMPNNQIPAGQQATYGVNFPSGIPASIISFRSRYTQNPNNISSTVNFEGLL